MSNRDWYPDDKETERTDYICPNCKKHFTAPEDMEDVRYCRECADAYESPD